MFISISGSGLIALIRKEELIDKQANCCVVNQDWPLQRPGSNSKWFGGLTVLSAFEGSNTSVQDLVKRLFELSVSVDLSNQSRPTTAARHQESVIHLITSILASSNRCSKWRNVWLVRRPKTKAMISPVTASSTHGSGRPSQPAGLFFGTHVGPPGGPAHLVDFEAHFQASIDVQGVYMDDFTTARAAPFFFKLSADGVAINT